MNERLDDGGGWRHCLVAVHRRAGALAGVLLVSTPVNWQIDYVIVHPDHRGEGIAAALVNETLNQALARKVPYVMLTSREGLRPLYEEACGFTVVGSGPGRDAPGVSPRDPELNAPGSRSGNPLPCAAPLLVSQS